MVHGSLLQKEERLFTTFISKIHKLFIPWVRIKDFFQETGQRVIFVNFKNRTSFEDSHANFKRFWNSLSNNRRYSNSKTRKTPCHKAATPRCKIYVESKTVTPRYKKQHKVPHNWKSLQIRSKNWLRIGKTSSLKKKKKCPCHVAVLWRTYLFIYILGASIDTKKVTFYRIVKV
jgi:hypothetical protein